MIDVLLLGRRTGTQHDATLHGKKIEIKSARCWDEDGTECKWQHLELGHDYDYVLMVFLGYDRIQVGVISKETLMGPLREASIVTPQGKQGFWTMRSSIMGHLTPITTVEDLHQAIK